MIFASDLDQTLIYSLRSARLQQSEKPEMKLVETYQGREISYMTVKAAALLKEIQQKMLFVPVTTRTIAQYQRVAMFQEEIHPKYAVTSNGGNILINGSVDLDWQRVTAAKIRETSILADELQQQFQELAHDSWVLKRRTADDLFHYYIIEQSLAPLAELTDFKQTVSKAGWRMSLQGRKLYFVPEPVNKEHAVEYIKQQEGGAYTAAAGDSLLDLGMLKAADFAIAPAHGELNKEGTEFCIARTRQAGIMASEEILAGVLAVYTEKQSAHSMHN